jgi:hypothetical protein
MRITVGNILTEKGNFEPAIWEIDEGTTLDLVTEDEFVVFRIQPDDFLGLAAAVEKFIKLKHEMQQERLQGKGSR